jgi:hypothetical protein
VQHQSVVLRDVCENGWLDWTLQWWAMTMGGLAELVQWKTSNRKGMQNVRQRRQEGQGQNQETKGDHAG